MSKIYIIRNKDNAILHETNYLQVALNYESYNNYKGNTKIKFTGVKKKYDYQEAQEFKNNKIEYKNINWKQFILKLKTIDKNNLSEVDREELNN